MEDLKAKVDVLFTSVEGMKDKVDKLTEVVHRIDKDQAVLGTNFTTMSQNVATLTTSVATLAVTINKQSGAVAIIKVLWAVLGAAGAWVVGHWKGYGQ